MARSTPEAQKLIKYLVQAQAQPGLLETKNSDGDTPLMMACHFGRTSFVKLLIAAGADQSTRNKAGQNILHYAVSGLPRAEQLEAFIRLLDKDLLPHLFVSRNNLHGSGGLTPLHLFVEATAWPSETGYNSSARRSAYKTDKEWLDVFNLLLRIGGGAELEMLNGAGDTMLHTAVMRASETIVRALLAFRPSLLYRENAVGRTPAEVARDRVTATEKFRAPNIPGVPNDTGKSVSGLVHRAVGDFAPDKKPSTTEAAESDASKVWKVCLEYMEKHPSKRRLVSLNEANDVAKRLGEQYSSSRYFSIQARGDDDDDDDEAEGDKEERARDVEDFSVQSKNQRSGSRWQCEKCFKTGTDCRCGEKSE